MQPKREQIKGYLMFGNTDFSRSMDGLRAGGSLEEYNPIIFAIRDRISTALRVDLETMDVVFTDRPNVPLDPKLQLILYTFCWLATSRIESGDSTGDWDDWAKFITLAYRSKGQLSFRSM